MTDASTRTKALGLLAETGMWRSNYEPPWVRLAWRLGFAVPPPHFIKFVPNFLLAGTFFGVAFGMIVWFSLGVQDRLPILEFVLGSVATGALFGLFMASYYLYGNRKHKLPRWGELDSLGPE